MRVSDLRRSPLLREVGLVFAWKVLQLGLTVVGGFLVARALGPGEYGVYAYALTWTQLLILPITLGFPTVVMREVGAARVHGRWGEVRGLFVWAGIWTIFTWILVSLAVVGLALHVPGMLPERQSALIHLLPMLLFMGWGGIFSASLRGLERIPRANFPVGQIWVVALFAALYVHGKLHLNAALLTQVTAAGFALLVYGWWAREFLPRDFWNARTQYLVRAWMASALPLFVVGTLFTLNGQIDILMLGALRSSNEIGLYRLANRLAGFIGFFLVVANAVIARNAARIEKVLRPVKAGGEPVLRYTAFDHRDEAAFVAREARRLLERYRPDEIAVLYRTNAQSRVLEEAFRREGVAHRVVGGTAFFARREVKDLLAYARAAVLPGDEVALLRILNTPPRGIG
ncbi:MAG: oligosaccharide flippase family protein, partial [Candidatus Hydrothermae bacterium]|nr:oligosaccharide flippase family protein [Candidatus Hydrothermae bacterium]